ncbi:hypothetical protein F5Y01DRAFT_17568 [Xylaria sp. FL0043]|nr:hypothetical protein F5Y01DRAFT_17568 [Xylaria sp. FL0043]
MLQTYLSNISACPPTLRPTRSHLHLSLDSQSSASYNGCSSPPIFCLLPSHHCHYPVVSADMEENMSRPTGLKQPTTKIPAFTSSNQGGGLHEITDSQHNARAQYAATGFNGGQKRNAPTSGIGPDPKRKPLASSMYQSSKIAGTTIHNTMASKGSSLLDLVCGKILRYAIPPVRVPNAQPKVSCPVPTFKHTAELCAPPTRKTRRMHMR